MGKIFCLMGKSSSGKDTIFKYLIQDEELGLKPIISYTTRPRRAHEIEGIEYHFIDEADLNEYNKQNKVIEQRVYNTVHGKWYYSTIDDGQIDLSRDNYLLITTLEAYICLRKYFGNENVEALYVTLDDGVRLERAVKRERQQVMPNYDEICRRFLADSIDFSNEKLMAAGIEQYYINADLDNCVNEIRNNIEISI